MLGPCWRPTWSKIASKKLCQTHMRSKRFLEVSWARFLGGFAPILEGKIHENICLGKSTMKALLQSILVRRRSQKTTNFRSLESRCKTKVPELNSAFLAPARAEKQRKQNARAQAKNVRKKCQQRPNMREN